MPPWVGLLLALSAVAVAAALVAALVALRRVALRAEAVLGILAQDLHPLVAETRALLDEIRALTREANREMERLGAVTERAHEVADGLGRIVGAIGGIARAGQFVSLAIGLRKGLDVFVSRLRKDQGEHHG